MLSIEARLLEQRTELFGDDKFSLYKNRWVIHSLYGSQNYGLSTESSDIDSYIFVVPTLEDIIKEKYINYEYKCENNEHINIKDIRHLLKILKKGSINYLELIYSNYCYTTNKEWVEELRVDCNNILANRKHTLYKSIYGMFKTSYNLYINKHNQKDIYRAFYFSHIIEDLYNGANIVEAMDRRHERNFLLEIKIGSLVFEDSDILKLKHHTMEIADKLLAKVNDEEDNMEYLDELFIRLMKDCLSNELFST